jgi:hypothetical protein
MSMAALLAARLHHQDLALVDRVDGLLLGVEAAAVGLEEVLAVGHVAQGPGQAHDPLLRTRGREAVDADVVQSALAQLGGQGGGADAFQFGLQFRGQDRSDGGGRRLC